MKITLVAIHPCRSPQAVPLACALLAEALLAAPALAGALEVSQCDFFLGDPPERCAEMIREGRPDLVAFSVYLWSREAAAAVSRVLRLLSPSTILCAGGPEPTAEPKGLFREGAFDFVICGEGEASFPRAVEALLGGDSLSGIPGVVVPGENGPSAPPAPVEPDAVPSPYLSGRLDPTAVGGALWQLSRGCDFACSFCFDAKGGGGVRRVSLERIEEELKLFARLEVPQVFVLDSTFNKVPARAKAILKLIREHAPRVHFHFEVRSEFIDPELAELFASVTCSLQIGLQSADRDVLRGVGRGFDREDFSRRVSLLNASGAVFGFDLIYGLPGDTLPLFCASLDFALSLYPNHLDIFPLAVLPGTRLFRQAGALGLEHLPSPPYTLTRSPGFSAEELKQAGRLAAACDIFYSRGRAVAWFNSVALALKLTPCAFLTEFSHFLGERASGGEEGIPDQEIWGLQRAFLERIFRQRRRQRLLPLALDLVDYHHYYAQALLAAPPAPPAPRELKKIDPWRRPLALAGSAALAQFNYEILDILEAGEPELAEFASCFRAARSYAVVYPAGGEVCTESLSRPYYELLAALDGKTSAQALCARLAIPRAEALSFLEFALSEGIAVLP